MRFAGTLAYEPRADAMALVVGLSWDPTPRLWKNACMPGSSTACCANTGVAIAVDNIRSQAEKFEVGHGRIHLLVDPCAHHARASDRKTRICFMIFPSTRNREVAFK